MFAENVSCLVEVHVERLQVSDRGLGAASNCLGLEILQLVKTPECTNVGLVVIADGCKHLRKLHIDGSKRNRIGDEGLIAIARRCMFQRLAPSVNWPLTKMQIRGMPGLSG
ncbi:hypothetical protein IFM89_013506 [Coptis chinensis]|uniref:Uncharacterized protein n=1 Tax=Coptis chinensis TaxID=261450 RepID=A0A835H2Q3_9MAGN|nr:hypothetical protein IFM89_013506 [Coptis chinensis]